MSSGYMNRIHFTPGGANWEDADPLGPWLNAPGLDFKWLGEQEPEANYIGWVSPMVNAMDQVVLRTIWGNSDDDPTLGFADYFLLFGTFDEDEPDTMATATFGYMLVHVDLSVMTGDFLLDMIDIDISHFFGGADVTHVLCSLMRWHLGEGIEADRLTLENIRTLTPEEIALAQNILPWEESPEP